MYSTLLIRQKGDYLGNHNPARREFIEEMSDDAL